jgi:hypothetical protein
MKQMMMIESISEFSDRTKAALRAANLFTVEDISTKQKKEIKKIKGLGEQGFCEVVLYCKKNKVKFAAPPKDPDALFKKQFVERFLKPGNINWASEMRVATKLLKLYPDKDKLNAFALPFKLNSLCFFLTEKGKEMIRKAYYTPTQAVAVKIEKRVEVGTEKVGEDIVTAAPKSLRDFLND